MKRINDVAADAADDVLAWLQGVGEDKRSYRWYVSAVNFYKRAGYVGSELSWLDQHSDWIKIADEHEYNQSVRDAIDSLKYLMSNPDITLEEFKALEKQLANCMEYVARFEKFRQQVDLTITADFRTLAEIILLRAMEKCPVKTGELIKSGGYDVYPDGFEVWFSSSHAWFAHENCTSKGRETADHPIHHVQGYKGHTGYYYNCHGGGHFLENAVQETFPDLQLVGDNYIQNDGDGGIFWRYNIGMGGLR